jgi:hypothetical protein
LKTIPRLRRAARTTAEAAVREGGAKADFVSL